MVPKTLPKGSLGHPMWLKMAPSGPPRPPKGPPKISKTPQISKKTYWKRSWDRPWTKSDPSVSQGPSFHHFLIIFRCFLCDFLLFRGHVLYLHQLPSQLPRPSAPAANESVGAGGRGRSPEDSPPPAGEQGVIELHPRRT